MASFCVVQRESLRGYNALDGGGRGADAESLVSFAHLAPFVIFQVLLKATANIMTT